MTFEKAIEILLWHSENSTQGHLSESCRTNHEFEEAYRTVFGPAPSYKELINKIRNSTK